MRHDNTGLEARNWDGQSLGLELGPPIRMPRVLACQCQLSTVRPAGKQVLAPPTADSKSGEHTGSRVTGHAVMAGLAVCFLSLPPGPIGISQFQILSPFVRSLVVRWTDWTSRGRSVKFRKFQTQVPSRVAAGTVGPHSPCSLFLFRVSFSRSRFSPGSVKTRRGRESSSQLRSENDDQKGGHGATTGPRTC